jgi:spermidine synthase
MGFQNTGRQAPKATWTLRLVLSLIGFTAVIAQVMLMRELLVVFYGNELALGVMLANWLLWTALGAGLLGRWAMRTRNPRKLVASLQTLLAFALPVTLLAVRDSKDLCHSLPGEILGPVPMFLTSFATLSVLCVISGGLFAAGSRLFRDITGASTATATGAVYLLEAAGSGVGGVLAGLALVRLSNPFEITALLGVLNLFAAWAVLAPVSTRRRVLGASFAVMAALVILCGYELQPLSLARLWRGFNLVAAQNSVYGSLAVVETGASRSLFENGLIVMTVPDPAAAEEAVHFALLEHPEPHRLLLIGGGVNGSVAEALVHPSLERIDYVELDPKIFDIAARYFPAAWERIRGDSRVHVHSMDGRRFLKSTPDSFDVIIVNLPDPHTAQLNRFYTEEFYREAAAKLRPGGIVSFQVTSSENYISQELADFLRCLEHTLRQVFSEVTAIPGDTVHFFAAAKPGTLTSDPQELLRRLRARHLHTQYVREYFLPFRMSPDRMQDLQLQIEPLPSTPINHDFAPVAYYFDVALWSAPFHQTSVRWFEALASMSFKQLLMATLLVLGALVPLLWLWPASREDKPVARARRSAAFAVAVVGFTELGLEILLLLGFQALYGYVYHELTMLVALFMVGVALGAWLALRPASSPDRASLPRDLRLLAGLQILLGASPLLLYGLFLQLGRVSSAGGQWAASQILFPALALVAGLLGGFQFLLASRAYFGDTPESAQSAGMLYALDLAGACAGALALSALLIPIFGFLRTAALMAAVNLAPAGMAAATGWERLAGQGSSQYPANVHQKPTP